MDGMYCSRMYHLKSKATADAKWMKRNGGRDIRISGSRGRWLVRAYMPLTVLAKFCSMEAHRETRDTADNSWLLSAFVKLPSKHKTPEPT